MSFFTPKKKTPVDTLPDFDADAELLSLGVEKFTYLVGFTENISKEVHVYYHRLFPDVKVKSSYFKTLVKQLPSGKQLIEGGTSFYDAFIRDDLNTTTRQEGDREWFVKNHETLIYYLGGASPNKYKYNNHYSPSLDAMKFKLIVNDLIKEVLRLSENDYIMGEKLLAIMIASNYVSIPELIHIAKNATADEITKYIIALNQAEDMKLPIKSHIELFEAVK